MMIRWPWTYKPTGRSLYWWEIEPIIAPWKHPGLEIGSADKDYLLVHDPARLIRASNVHRMTYIPERRDCDDFVRALRGWLSKQGMGHVFCADCRVEFNGKVHSGAGFIGADDRLHVWDVQAVKRMRDYRILGLWA